MSKYRRVLGELCGKRHVKMEFLGGKDWKLIQNPDDPLRFVCAVGTRTLTPPDGYVFDGATVPEIAWPIVGPPTGFGEDANYMLAACMHDKGYEHQKWDDGATMTRREADGIFLECMIDDNVSEWRYRLMWFAVRVGGAFTFKGHRNWNEHNDKPQSDYTPSKP